MITWLENLAYAAGLKELRLFSGSGGPHHSTPVPRGQLPKGERLSLHKEQHGENKSQWVHVAPGDISI